ncbi:MAG: hypothetical protein O7D86_08825 [Proteobacteria bacterium]|nr:hypothetical protein [Pseudomonadota bacterium]
MAYKKLLRDKNDNPVGILPQAFEMRKEKNEKTLSVNWLEYFGNNHEDNIVKAIKSFRLSRNNKVGEHSAFGIANVGKLEDTCAKHRHTKVRVLYDEKKNSSNNKSHATIIRLPINDLAIMQSLASVVFTELVSNKDIP